MKGGERVVTKSGDEVAAITSTKYKVIETKV